MSQKPTAWGAGRVAFFAQLEEIRGLVAARWPLSQIYRERRQSLGGITYSAFTKYVRKHIGRPDEAAKSPGGVGKNPRGRAAPPPVKGGTGSAAAAPTQQPRETSSEGVVKLPHFSAQQFRDAIGD
jgi:hypothetical protein